MSEPNLPKTLSPESLEWNTALRLFLLRCKAQNLSQRMQGHYAETLAAFSRHLKTEGSPPPAEIRALNIRGFIEYCKAKGNAPSTVDTRYRHLKTFFRYLVRDGLLLTDPRGS